MGWSSWVKGDDGVSSGTKTESHSDGSSDVHHINDVGKGTGRGNHHHVMTKKDSSGKSTSAHSFGRKGER